jgi:hypothetical protein
MDLGGLGGLGGRKRVSLFSLLGVLAFFNEGWLFAFFDLLLAWPAFPSGFLAIVRSGLDQKRKQKRSQLDIPLFLVRKVSQYVVACSPKNVSRERKYRAVCDAGQGKL